MSRQFCRITLLMGIFFIHGALAEAQARDAQPVHSPLEADLIRSGAGEITELWSGKVLSASFRTGMCFDATGKARGVLKLRHANGQVDVYHLYGTIRDNQFDLSHSSGHFFTGRLTGEESMSGQVRLRNGLKLSLEGKRERDVPLLRADCAPLD